MIPVLEQAARLISQLNDRFVQLGGLPPPDWQYDKLSELITRVSTLEARTRMECDEIIRLVVAAPIGAPKPTTLQAYFLACRCRCALDTLAILTRAKDDISGSQLLTSLPDDWSESDLLLWLLIETWGERHDVWLKLTAAAVATGNPYYSG